MMHHQVSIVLSVAISYLNDGAAAGTLKVVQVFVTRCLNAFTRQPHLSEGLSEVKADYLELIAVHCADRVSAFIRTSHKGFMLHDSQLHFARLTSEAYGPC